MLAYAAALLLVAAGIAAGATIPDEPVLLPDGTRFETWERSLRFTRTYHVAQRKPNASDRNPGTAASPFRTISRAASLLRPGERVVIHAGTYREWVKPARGGASAEAMISYEAAPGEDVVITGADPWKPRWVKTRHYAPPNGVVTWEAEVPGRLFAIVNPFCLPNFTPQKDAATWRFFPSFEQRRGQVIVDGKLLEQVSLYAELAGAPGRFWVEENGSAIHARMPDDGPPDGHRFEITTREHVFAPTTRFLNYIRVKGLRMFYAANGVPIPPPQRGLLSAMAGNHWIIEDCEIGFANTLGMDLGGQWWDYVPRQPQGFHIVRRNHIHHCGISAMSAWHNRANERLLVEDNLITDNCWMPVEEHYESAGVKLHRTEHSLIRRNVVLRTKYGSSLWLDGEIVNTRVTQNLFYDAETPMFGHVFLEINKGPNLIDNNIMIRSGSNGFYEHDAERCIVVNNLIADGKGTAICLRPGDPKRVSPPFENEHRAYGNILTGFPAMLCTPNPTTRSDYNLFGVPADALAKDTAFVYSQNVANPGKRVALVGWQGFGQDGNAVASPVEVRYDPDTFTLRLTAPGLQRLPEFRSYPDAALAGLAPLATTLTSDYLGRPRAADRYQVGPLLDPPLDGTPIRVDPRRVPTTH